MSKRLTLLGALVVLAALAATAFATTAGAGSSATAQDGVSCKNKLRIAIMTPLTGDAGFIGNEQLTWAELAVKQLPKNYGLKIQLLRGDTQLDTSVASTLAQKYVADKRVVAIIGPAASPSVAATSKAFFAAGLAHISMSATRVALTKGAVKEGTPSFFRVVPDDSVQGPSVARFMVTKLNAKKVVIIDDQESYSTGLATSAGNTLKRLGATVIRESVPQTRTDFSSLVTRIPNDTDVVFLPWQLAPKAQTFAQQLKEQGKKAVVFGSDGTNAPGVFKVPGSYVSNFAADISSFDYNKDLIATWQKDNPDATLGSFGPPTYGAVDVALAAIKRACNKGNGQILDRRDVVRNVKKYRKENWILGGDFRFSTKTNDPKDGAFYIFQIQNDGSYKLVD